MKEVVAVVVALVVLVEMDFMIHHEQIPMVMEDKEEKVRHLLLHMDQPRFYACGGGGGGPLGGSTGGDQINDGIAGCMGGYGGNMTRRKHLMLSVVVVFSELDLVVAVLQGVEETEEKVHMVV